MARLTGRKVRKGDIQKRKALQFYPLRIETGHLPKSKERKGEQFSKGSSLPLGSLRIWYVEMWSVACVFRANRAEGEVKILFGQIEEKWGLPF